MSKLIIFEGPDCCGKTTLAKAYARANKAMYFHCTATPALFNALGDYHINVFDNAETNIANGVDVVLDRFWPSEVAYGVMFKRPSSQYPYNRLSELCYQANALYVFCMSPGAWDRYAKGHIDPAHSLTKAEFYMVYENYKQLYKKQAELDPIRTISYILEDDGMNGKMDRYIKTLDQWNP